MKIGSGVGTEAELRTLLRDTREEQSFRQSDVAARLGVAQSFVSKYESGERRLDFLEVRAVCNALGVPFLEFVQRLESRIRGDG
jgi:transcriptional regulator with XRE-family HTH domain